MKIEIPSSWQELNEWQLGEIVDLYLNHNPEDFEKAYTQMVFILFQKKKELWTYLKLRKLLRNIPLSTLMEYGKFLLEPPVLHSFPEIRGLKKPADRLGDLSIKQFSFMDQFYYLWKENNSEQMLRALAASIYRLGNEFDEQNLPKIALITDKLTRKQRQVIGFTYMSCYHHLTEQFPVVYPPNKETEAPPKQPYKKHIPFSEVIISVAMNEMQPLGNLHESNHTRIYEFMNVFSKILIHNEKMRKTYEKK